MNQFAKIVACLLIAMIPFVSANAAPVVSTPIGYWKTIDDGSGEAKSIVQIWQTPDHKLYGKVVKLYQNPDKLCSACQGQYHNQKILGMTVMQNFKQNEKTPAQWVDGEILDPKNGKTYHCNIHLTENNQKLNVRGYIGLPLFGRSQTWVRVIDID